MNRYAARLWDVQTGRGILSLPHDHEVENVLFSPEGRILATFMAVGNDTAAQVWDSATGASLARFTVSPSGGGFGLGSFGPDGRYLAVSSFGSWVRNGQVLVWDTERNREVARLVLEQRGNRSFSNGHLDFNADGQHIAVEHGDKVSIWHWPTDRVIAQFHAPAKDYWDGVAFTPDGNRLVSAHRMDGKVRVWAWRAEDLIADACARLERNLTREEWRVHVGEEEYQATCLGLSVPEN